MKVRWWPFSYKPAIASVRLRCLGIMGYLRTQNVDAELYRQGESAPDVLVLGKRYDLATLEEAWRLRKSYGTRIVLDLCDNHFYMEQPDARLQARASVLERAIAGADLVVTATSALADSIAGHLPNRGRVAVIGDAVEMPMTPIATRRWVHPVAEWRLYRLRQALMASQVPVSRRLVWFGNHGSPGVSGGMADLPAIRAALDVAARQALLSVTVISNNRGKFLRLTQDWDVPVFYLPWEQSTFSRALELHSAAVIPVSRNPFTVCKTNNRLATALVHGLNVIADVIPSYAEFGDCMVLDDWQQGLGSYLADSDRRADDIRKGQRILTDHYGIGAIGAQWMRELLACAGQPSAGVPLQNSGRATA